MSRVTNRQNHALSPCACLEQVFRGARRGESASITSCSSSHCPIREVEPRVLEDFLRFIGELPDDPSNAVAALR